MRSSQFIDEAKLGSVLTHSNIVTVSDFGKVGEGYYLAAGIRRRPHAGADRRALPREVRPHDARRDRLSRRPRGAGRASPTRTTALDTQGRPLGIVHRDVSPTNIMISFEGEVKLLDFGIVKATERVSKTREGNVKGNVGYMSPEQARGLDVTNRSDLFSLGLVMFELLSGEPFYQGGGAGEILYQAATGPTVEHLARIAKLPPPAPDFLRRVLAMDPAARYPSRARLRAGADASATMAEGPARRDDARAVRGHLSSFSSDNPSGESNKSFELADDRNLDGREINEVKTNRYGMWARWPIPCFSGPVVNGTTNNNNERGRANMFSINRVFFAGAVVSAVAAALMASGCAVGGGMQQGRRGARRDEAGRGQPEDDRRGPGAAAPRRRAWPPGVEPLQRQARRGRIVRAARPWRAPARCRSATARATS